MLLLHQDPTGQVEHTLSVVAVYTVLAHWAAGQAVTVVQKKVPEAEVKVSAGQEAQLAGPVVLLLVPGGQMEQGLAPPLPVYPALQAHCASALLAIRLLVLFGQGVGDG